MYATKLALAIAPLLLTASADLSIDREDIPRACEAICAPVRDLGSRCDVDLRSDNDRDEGLLERQCFCTNKSFDVKKITSLCASCMHQHINDRDNRDGDDDDDDRREDLQDVDDIMRTCGFSSVSYASAASTEAQSITVSAVAPTDISQLTTTIVPGSGAGGSGSSPTQSSGSSNGGSSSSGSGGSGSTSNTASGAAASQTGDNAAGLNAPAMYLGSAMVIGAAMLMI